MKTSRIMSSNLIKISLYEKRYHKKYIYSVKLWRRVEGLEEISNKLHEAGVYE